jgi:3-isopropylmalate/(R)-2-methylmalate dehydratase large subunit
MGSTEASIYMASPATVAASAIAGHITAPVHTAETQR